MYLSDYKINVLQNYFGSKPIKKAFLFGSYATGKATEHSDIDLMLEIDYAQQKVSMFDFISWKQELESLNIGSIDLVASDGVSKFFKPQIESEKKVLYER